MARLLKKLIELVGTGQLVCPLLVSTGIHTTVLVALGVIVAGSTQEAHSPAVAMAIGLGTGGGPGELDGSSLETQPLGADDNLADGNLSGGETAGYNTAAYSTAELSLAGAQLAAASLAADEDAVFGVPTAPLNVLASAEGSANRQASGAAPGDSKGNGSAMRRKTSAGGSGKGQGNGRSGGKGAGAGGKPGHAAGSGFFGLPTAAGKVVFIVDISGSMHGRRIRRAQTELRHTLESLKPSQKFFVVFFSDGATAMPAEGLLSATRDNIIQAWQWIRQAECGGGTNPLPAVLMALELKPDAIYLLTDGKFEPQVYFAATEAPPGARTPINTIGFATKKAERLLQAIANETGGSYRFVP